MVSEKIRRGNQTTYNDRRSNFDPSTLIKTRLPLFQKCQTCLWLANPIECLHTERQRKAFTSNGHRFHQPTLNIQVKPLQRLTQRLIQINRRHHLHGSISRKNRCVYIVLHLSEKKSINQIEVKKSNLTMSINPSFTPTWSLSLSCRSSLAHLRTNNEGA